ncbi:ABC transporter ATP-binding protein [Pelagibius sp. Alg239-R121]|uniref:ABC transporter ATP-binding protein n=1 Tax=Pelagibius sp. Alg239-R121 TaxID=2993448 RepID=UPI0024A717B2|nr:ABC transporter ATP-binding protein [Pelagibius sp. Alg239-R121]
MAEKTAGTAGANGSALRLEKVSKTFHQGENDLAVLQSVSLNIEPGELVSLVGPSGAGKSTLLHIAGLLESADKGEVWIGGKPSSKLNDLGLTSLRRSTIGFVYQYHHLLPEFSALENIVLPQMLAGIDRQVAGKRALELLDMVKLADRAEHRPGQLSGGEQQRVAIARGLANAPAILLADEPTGNLDPETADSVFAILVDLVRNVGLGALIATHNLDLAARMDRTLRFEHGRIS